MKTSNKNSKKQLLALCLSVLMLSSTAAFAACKESSTDSSISSSAPTAEEKKDALVKNGNFENFAFNASAEGSMTLLGTSVSSWSKSKGSDSTGSAPTSKAESGIISTKEEDWKQLTTTNEKDVTTLSETDASKKWKDLTVKDKILYMENWEDENPDEKIEKKLSFYQSTGIDSEDLPTCENPLTHENAEDSNVLMIHNDYPTLNEYYSVGTAQYYTSSSTVTLKAGTAGKLSLWVKTMDLKMASLDKEGQDAVNKGAYISLAHTVGSKTMPAFEVKNINTEAENIETNNGWKQYTFYLNSSSYADTTFTLTLGLGQGGSGDKFEHVNGYAFFDDVQCEIISRDEYRAANVAQSAEFDFGTSEEDKTVVDSDVTTYGLNMYGDFATISEEFFKKENVEFTATTEKSKEKLYTVATGKYANKEAILYRDGISTDNDVLDILKPSEMEASENKYLKQVYADYFKDNKFVTASDDVLMLMSANGAAHTANAKHTFTLGADKYTAISFFVRTSDLNGFTGGGVTLNDGANKQAIANIDTTSITTVDINDEEKDIYDGWQQCLFYVKNETDTEKTFTLSFNYGLTTVLGTTAKEYYAGFAAFAKFEQRDMDASEFEVATSGTYASVVSLTGAKEEEVEGVGFDTVATVPSDKIETGYANPRNYKGVYSDSQYVNNANVNTSVNQNATAGLLNKKYASSYTSILEKLGGASWNEVFGDATQPLVIYNDGEQKNAYGFIGKETTIAANTYATIALRVKVSANASAYVYLMDMDDNTHQSALSIGRQVSYWYDDDGNVCSKDPADHSFNEKKHTAFILQSNGLYKLSDKWEGYDKVDKTLRDKYFANLTNYEVEKDTNDLLVAEGGVSYNYNDKIINDGNDGKAYYAYNKESKMAYADSKKTVEVYDFAKAELTARYTALEGKKGLTFEVGATNGEWATVTFYVHTGDTEKNYRLEVWNGSRDAQANIVNPANSYVMFDSHKPDDVDATSFEELVNGRKEDVKEEAYFESVYSFYDSAKFLRYNEKLDENKVGNSYDDYVSSAYTSSIAYLTYDEGNVYEMFADFALSEVTAAVDVEEDDSTTDDTDDGHNHDAETNIWLLASSIAIAVILLLAMVSIIVQKAVKSYQKKNGISPKKKANKNNHTDK